MNNNKDWNLTDSAINSLDPFNTVAIPKSPSFTNPDLVKKMLSVLMSLEAKINFLNQKCDNIQGKMLWTFMKPILSTNSLKKCKKISLENLHMNTRKGEAKGGGGVQGCYKNFTLSQVFYFIVRVVILLKQKLWHIVFPKMFGWLDFIAL